MVTNENNKPSQAKNPNENESLAQRRARLRGTLTKQAIPNDPFGLGNIPQNQTNQSQTTANTGSNTSINGSDTVSGEVSDLNQANLSQDNQVLENIGDISTTNEEGNHLLSDFIFGEDGQEVDGEIGPILEVDLDSIANFDDNTRSPSDASDISELDSQNTDKSLDWPVNETVLNPIDNKQPDAKQTVASSKSVKNKSKLNQSDKNEDKSVNNKGLKLALDTSNLDNETLSVLKNLDLGIDVCATNIAQIHHMLKDSLESKISSNANSFSEIGVSLTVLIESLSAALEPLQAVGELVPAVSELVSAIDAKLDQDGYNQVKLTPDELITNLAFQLSNGQIDPWTFKCAYMSIFPEDHPADLLHRLVELLGTQRLAGNLFRAAYDAVQSSGPGAGNDQYQYDSAVNAKLLKEIETLKLANTKLNESLVKQEELLNEQLNIRDQELLESSDEIRIKFEELNTRFSELNNSFISQSTVLAEKDSEIQNKTFELSTKNQEVNQLKAQIEELKEQYKDMITNLQQELSKSANESLSLKNEIKSLKSAGNQNASSDGQPNLATNPSLAKEQVNNSSKPLFKQDLKAQTIEPGFFDANPIEESEGSLFDSGPSRPIFDKPVQTGLLEQNNIVTKPNNANNSQPKISQPVLNPQSGKGPQMQTNSINSSIPNNSALVNPATSSLLNSGSKTATYDFSYKKPGQPSMSGPIGTGNYGTGIRSQVFEVIVRQALEGQPWRETCVGPMTLNAISVDEIEAEVDRRKKLLQK